VRRLLSPIFALLLLTSLAACDTAEERAEGHYQSALTLIAEGDIDRAIVELRNVFRLVPDHKEARYELARAFLSTRDSPRQAYGQFLRIAEQYPDDVEARIELSLLAFVSANWEEMERHGSKAIELEPENLRVKTIEAALNYRTAVSDSDDRMRGEAVRYANELIEANGSNRVLSELLLDNHLRELEFTDALAALDALATEFPDTKRYKTQRLQVLISIGDQQAIEDQLLLINAEYPDDDDMKQMLVRYYLARGELDKTEAFLRQLVENAGEDDTGARIELISFLMRLRSFEDANAELVAAIETEENPVPYIIFKAALDFSTGNQSVAIADLEAAIETAEPSTEINQMRVSLAQMLTMSGNEVGARSLVEEVLEADSQQPGALKLNAKWLIDADETDAAIADLRIVLDFYPEDADAMTMMSEAYMRSGSTGLARDFLSLAVEASGNAPVETISYVRFLMGEERFLPAEDVLLPALRIAPNDLDLLNTAAELYLAIDDFGRLQQVIDTLRREGSDQAILIANSFEAARLNQTSGSEQELAFLEELAKDAEPGDVSQIMLVRARLSQSDFEGAIALAEEILAGQPENPVMRLMLAQTLVSAGELDRAIAIYDDLIEALPESGQLPVELSALQLRNNLPELARETIETARERMPDNPYLMWAYASYLEKDGDIDSAIEVYEDLYAADSSNIVVANNLASLLATYRDDDVSLELAWTIARRFSESDVAAVQDTYGWIAFRRGEVEEALPYLEAAAANLADPIVRFHFAEVLLALDRKAEALDQYRSSLSLVGVGDTRPQIIRAREKVVELEAESATATE
jgi:tetratricopeptide (TPR) repeat protein